MITSPNKISMRPVRNAHGTGYSVEIIVSCADKDLFKKAEKLFTSDIYDILELTDIGDKKLINEVQFQEQIALQIEHKKQNMYTPKIPGIHFTANSLTDFSLTVFDSKAATTTLTALELLFKASIINADQCKALLDRSVFHSVNPNLLESVVTQLTIAEQSATSPDKSILQALIPSPSNQAAKSA
jgi:hypothetical protein